jgi:hypothetical protein
MHCLSPALYYYLNVVHETGALKRIDQTKKDANDSHPRGQSKKSKRTADHCRHGGDIGADGMGGTVHEHRPVRIYTVSVACRCGTAGKRGAAIPAMATRKK